MKRYTDYLFLILLALSSCIGTDLVDEPLGPVPARLALSHETLVLLEGESQQLSAQVIASDESVLDISVSWSSRDPLVASVDTTGLLSAVAEGQVWIDVQSPTLTDSILVTVSIDPEALASISITNTETNLAIGDSLQLALELRNANGVLLSDKVIMWESSDPAVASVDATGLVIALANGNTQISASSEGLSSLPIAITVEPATSSRSGTFQGLNGYTVQGTAVLERTGGEAKVIFNEDFRSQNGPGLYVYISPNATNVSGGVSLGMLKSTSGMQSYDIPDNVDLDNINHVLVYCQPFRVPFGTANLE